MKNNLYESIAYFVNRDICEHAYTSLFSHNRSNISVIKNGEQNKVISKIIDYNFFEILPFVFNDLLRKNKTVLYLEVSTLQNEEVSICFYYPRESIKIRKNKVISNNVVTDEKKFHFIEIYATKDIIKLKYEKHIKELSKISNLPSNVIPSINSNIPVDYANYELEKNTLCLRSTKDLGGLFGYDNNALHITGFYSYLREIKRKRLQYALFKNMIDAINQHFQTYRKDLGMDLCIKIDSRINEELNDIENRMKMHEVGLLSVGDIIYNISRKQDNHSM